MSLDMPQAAANITKYIFIYIYLNGNVIEMEKMLKEGNITLYLMHVMWSQYEYNS